MLDQSVNFVHSEYIKDLGRVYIRILWAAQTTLVKYTINATIVAIARLNGYIVEIIQFSAPDQLTYWYA
jgi:hypothetical protein